MAAHFDPVTRIITLDPEHTMAVFRALARAESENAATAQTKSATASNDRAQHDAA